MAASSTCSDNRFSIISASPCLTASALIIRPQLQK
jgi:hypothetical protein